LNNIVLVLALLLAFVTGFLLCLKAVNMGLKWQIQTKEGKEPKLDNPITKVVENIQTNKIIKEAELSNALQEKIHNEWLFGKEGE
jgi:hypothetical protein